MTVTTETTGTEAILAAHKVCGRLIKDMPDGVVFISWEVMEGYVGGQYSTLASLNGAKRALAVLANRFGLVYAEEPRGTFVQVEAAGELGGIQIQLWAHVNLPRADQLAAAHSCDNSNGIDPDSCPFNAGKEGES